MLMLILYMYTMKILRLLLFSLEKESL